MKKLLLLILLIGLFTFPSKAQYTKLFDFNFNTSGANPTSSLFSDGTYLYGMTRTGLSDSLGLIFKVKSDGTGYSILFDFDSINGAGPLGSLISDGTYLYGMTCAGGTYNAGVIFKIKPDGTNFTKLLDFYGGNGSYPIGSLTTDGNYLYGMAGQGGFSNYGVIFKIKTDGTGYSKLLDFAGLNGRWPRGDLFYDGTYLYGMTNQGGPLTASCSSGCGVIFKIKTDGTSYTKLYDFGYMPDAMYPGGSFISDGTFLYATSGGGVNGDGAIFKIKMDGTNYTKLFDFNRYVNGYGPTASLFYDGFTLFGMTTLGGVITTLCPSGCGEIFEIKPDGTGFTGHYYFTSSIDGFYPGGSLISDGTALYAMASNGGPSYNGTIFKFHPLGMGILETNSIDFTIYPNPSNGIFKLNLAGFQNSKTTELIICNLIGETIYQLSNEQIDSSLELQIDLNSQPNGIYFINIKSEKGATTKKIVLQK